MLRYALFAYGLPPGHFFPSKLQGIEETPGFDLVVSQENIQKAVQEFAHPDVESPEKATAVALGEKRKVKDKAPAPSETTVTVLNGNGVTGSAGTASYLLSQRGYQMVYPPDGKNANAPNWDYFKTQIAFDPTQRARSPRRTRSRTSSATARSWRSRRRSRRSRTARC